jgi:hypothetical protein
MAACSLPDRKRISLAAHPGGAISKFCFWTPSRLLCDGSASASSESIFAAACFVRTTHRPQVARTDAPSG